MRDAPSASDEGSLALSRPACVVRGEENPIPLIGDPLIDPWRVIGVCWARQLIWVGDWSGYSSDSRVRKPEVQDALAQRIYEFAAFELDPRRSNCMNGSPGRHPGGPGMDSKSTDRYKIPYRESAPMSSLWSAAPLTQTSHRKAEQSKMLAHDEDANAREDHGGSSHVRRNVVKDHA